MKISVLKVVSHSLIVISIFVYPAHAGLFDLKKDKTPAPWSTDPLLSRDDCTDISYTDIIAVVTDFVSDSDTKDVTLAAANLMSTYIVSSLAINRANLCMAEALNLEDTKQSLLEEKLILMSGTSMSKKEVAKHREFSAEASEKIQAAASQVDTIEPEQNKKLAVGVSTYLLGTYKTYDLWEDGKQLASNIKDTGKKESKGFSLSSASSKLKAGLDVGSAVIVTKSVVSGLPKHGEKIYETGAFLMEFANANDIEVEEDATAQFNAISGW